MDQDEALRLLRSGPDGVAEWNTRVVDSYDSPDLAGTDLRGADLAAVDLSNTILTGADLAFANLTLANLTDADVRRANLRRANLFGADLSMANLTLADLSMANLTRTILTDADLTGTVLQYAVFHQAGVDRAILHQAKLMATVLSSLDLSLTIGLDSVDFSGPCSIGADTLFLSRGKIPESFLLGCEVPESLVTNLPALIGSMKPIQFYSCFISYSHKDEEFAKRLHSRLREEGLSVWYAPEDMKGGEKIHEQIDQAIRVHDKLLLVLSKKSMESEWVKTEIFKAKEAEIRDGKRKLFPIRLVPFKTLRDWKCFDADSGKDLGREIREYLVPDFSKWKDHDKFEDGFARLISDLKKAGET